MKKRICILLAAILLLSAVLTGCGKAATATRIVHCDNCGKEIEVPEDSNMTDDWILYCSDCEKELGLDTIIP